MRRVSFLWQLCHVTVYYPLVATLSCAPWGTMTMSNQTIDEDGNEVEEKENVITKIVDWMVEKSLPEVDKYV